MLLYIYMNMNTYIHIYVHIYMLGIWPHMGTREALLVIKELKPETAYFTGTG